MSVVLRTRKRANNQITYYLDIIRGGERSREFLFKGDQKDKELRRIAKEKRAEREKEVLSGTYNFTPEHKQKVTFTSYMAELVRQKNNKPWKQTANIIKDFKGDILLSAIDESYLERLKTHLLSNYSPNSANMYFAKVKAALNQAKREKRILQNPADNVRNVPKKDAQREFLQLHELESLARTPIPEVRFYPDHHIKEAFLFSCFTGLRISDVRALSWGNIREDTIVFVQEKTERVEFLPLTVEAARILATVRNSSMQTLPESKIFTLPSEKSISVCLNKWAELAGIRKHITFHSGRHSYATLALSRGVDIYTVSKLLGHTSLKHTQIYARVIDEQKRQAVAKFPVLLDTERLALSSPKLNE